MSTRPVEAMTSIPIRRVVLARAVRGAERRVGLASIVVGNVALTSFVVVVLHAIGLT
jgi:hypothetical protein